MSRRLLVSISGLVAFLAVIYGFFTNQQQAKPPVLNVTPEDQGFLPGRNNTVVFATNSEHGLRNGILATISSVLVNHPQILVHVAGFPDLEPRINEIVTYARKTTPSAAVRFHPIKTRTFSEAVFYGNRSIHDLVHKPGFWGGVRLSQFIPRFMTPWSGEDHLIIFAAVLRACERTNPALVVVDPALFPAVESVRYDNRNHVILSTNTLKENAVVEQGSAMLWKYPVIGSGFTYPVPLHQIPANAFLNIYTAFNILTARHISETTKWLRKHKFVPTVSPFKPFANGAPLAFTQSLSEVEYPFTTPAKIKSYGPMVISLGKAEDQDPELAKWMKRAPVVLVNLGSVFLWEEDSIRIMAQALKSAIHTHKIHVVWKLKTNLAAEGIWREILKEELAGDRIRVVAWMNADPVALMETGNVALAVHHGGASSYAEPMSVGIPQMILPHWADCYDNAVRAEHFGLGVWANKIRAPELDLDELTQSFDRLLGNNEEAKKIQNKAREIGQVCQRAPGRDVAAAHIAHIAGGGKSEDFVFEKKE